MTADGQLRVANAASNPDLFWALRGGGGGTFGVVTEATVKAHRSPAIVMSLFYVNTTDPNDNDSIYPPLAYFHSQFPDLVEKGMSGFYYMFRNAVKGFFFTLSDAGGLPAKQLLDPVIDQMSHYPGIRTTTSFTVHWPFPNYKNFFDNAFGMADEGGKMPGKADGGKMPGMPMRIVDGTDGNGVEFGVMSEEVKQHIRQLRMDMNPRLARRHGPSSGEFTAEGTQALGIEPLDSILLEKEHLNHPNLAAALKASMPVGARGQLRGNLVAGKKVHTLGNDTSVNPAWRRAYSHIIASADGGGSVWPNTSPLKALGKDSGVYLNEVSAIDNCLFGSLTDCLGCYQPNELETGLLRLQLREAFAGQDQV